MRGHGVAPSTPVRGRPLASRGRSTAVAGLLLLDGVGSVLGLTPLPWCGPLPSQRATGRSVSRSCPRTPPWRRMGIADLSRCAGLLVIAPCRPYSIQPSCDRFSQVLDVPDVAWNLGDAETLADDAPRWRGILVTGMPWDQLPKVAWSLGTPGASIPWSWRRRRFLPSS